MSYGLDAAAPVSLLLRPLRIAIIEKQKKRTEKKMRQKRNVRRGKKEIYVYKKGCNKEPNVIS